MKSTNIRTLVCKLVHDVVADQKSLTTLIPEHTRELSAKDKGLAQELAFGTCRWYFHLSNLHQQYLKKRIHRNDSIVTTLLNVGSYQLLHTRIPNHAAIHETVEACKQLGYENYAGLVNAVLRKVDKHKDEESKNEKNDIADKSSHPDWMQSKISHNWPEQAAQIFSENNKRPPMALRINQQKSSRDEYLSLLSSQDIEATESPIAPQGIILGSPQSVENLPNFAEGWASVQDEAAQLCCNLLDLKPDQRVLDACAAPGGKTCAMLEAEPTLNLLALDCDKNRAKRIHENTQRLQLKAEVKVADAEKVDEWWDKQTFDRILLDAPCSATGVIRRHPDIKLLRKEGDIKNLAETQLKLLRALWLTLAEGGKLLYATCSIFPQENSRIIERFLKQEATAQSEPIEADWGLDTGFGRQLFPKENGHDGFFYALLTKQTS